jgi:UDP-N-acetylglucosamine 2-epimerase (hydrolysing)
VYGVPSIDIGYRQSGRYKQNSSILHSECEKSAILDAISKINIVESKHTTDFGVGNSTGLFMETISNRSFWARPIQKHFIDFDS